MTHKMIIGVELAKHLFQVCMVNHKGRLKANTTVTRGQRLAFIARQPPALIVMEACSGAHDWARRFRAWGHEVRLLAPQYVVPFRHGQKNDPNDALALTEIGFPVLGEDLDDTRACRHLDLGIGVDKGEVEPVRQPPAHGGLARAHQPDQHDAARAEGFADRQEPLLPVVFLMVAQPETHPWIGLSRCHARGATREGANFPCWPCPVESSIMVNQGTRSRILGS